MEDEDEFEEYREDEPFTVVYGTIKRSTRVSAVYHHIRRMGLGVIASVPNIKIVHPTKKRRAYLLERTTWPPEITFHNLLDYMPDLIKNKYLACRSVNRHIRIDEIFGTINSAMTRRDLKAHWHYTERYNMGDGKWIAVHVYFHYGIYLDTYIKERDCKPIRAQLGLASKAKQNALPDEKLMGMLVSDVAAAKTELNSLFENQKDDICSSAYLANVSDEDLNLAIQQCRDTSNILSFYQENEIDKRFDQFEETIITLRNRMRVHLATAEKVTTEALTSEGEAEGKAKPVTVKSRQKPREKERKRLNLEEIRAQYNAIREKYKDKIDAKNMIAFDKELQELKLELVVTYMTSDDKDVRLRSGCQAFEKALGSIPSLAQRFIDCVSKSQFAQATELFKHVKMDIPATFYMKFLQRIAQTYHLVVPATKQNEIIKFLEMLFDKSDDYRLLLSYIADCPEAIDLPGGKEFGMSILVKVVVRDSYDFFTTIIKQSANADHAGYVSNGKFASLLEVICSLSLNREYDKYILFLLENGARFENKFPFFRGWSCDVSNSSADPKISKLFSEPGTEDAQLLSLDSAQKHYNDFKNIPFVGSALTSYADGIFFSPGIIQKLLEKSSTLHIFIAFGRFILNQIYGMQCYSSNKLGILPAATKEKRLAISQSNSAPILSGDSPLKYVCYAFGSDDANKQKCVELFVNEIKKRVATLTTDQMLEFITKVDMTIDSHKQRSDNLNALACVKAKLFLGIHLDYSLLAHGLIMQCFVETAEIFASGEIQNYDQEGRAAQNTANYQFTLQLADNSPFKNELTRQSAYKKAYTALNPTVARTVEPSREKLKF